MIRNILDIEKSALLILGVLAGAIIASFLNTPMLLHVELDNIFNSFLINDITHNIITTNLEATNTPPLFFWIKHIMISVLGLDISMLKIIPALAMCGIIFITYAFISKQTGLKNSALIVSIILATSPFFITASKLISFDLIYILIYISTTFIFTSNVYSNNYSNLSTFIAGILVAAAFSLTGFTGAMPILINYLLINFIRGGFLINLKFNNPLCLLSGFFSFIVIWIMSIAEQLGTSQAIDLVFNYHFLNDFAKFDFDNGVIFKYITLFIIGGFPWISLLPSALWNTLRSLPNRLHTSDLKTGLPLISLANALFLVIYFANIEAEFYILLAIFFNFALMIGDRISDIEIKKSSFINIIFFIYAIAIMLLFLNEFLNIELTTYKLDVTVKQLLISEHTSISNVADGILYLMAGGYIIGALILYIYTVSRNSLALVLAYVFAISNLLIFSFAVFPNLTNSELNSNRNHSAWVSHSLIEDDINVVFYKTKDPIVASKAKMSFYFDDIIKAKEFITSDKVSNVTVFFNKKDRRLVARLKLGARANCRNDVCLLKIK